MKLETHRRKKKVIKKKISSWSRAILLTLIKRLGILRKREIM